MKKPVIFLLLILIAATGCMRKDIIKSMQEKLHENWMMIGKDLQKGDSALYCLADYTGGKKKLDSQCRKWTVIDRDENTVTLKLEIENGPSSLNDIDRIYVVDKDGFIKDATAVSRKSGEKCKIRIAEKPEGLSFERVVPSIEYMSDDLEILDRYSYKKGGKRYLKSDEYGQMEVVPIKVVFTPTKTVEKTKYYFTSNIAEFGYIIEIIVKRNLNNSKKDIMWTNQLKNTKQNVTAPVP